MNPTKENSLQISQKPTNPSNTATLEPTPKKPWSFYLSFAAICLCVFVAIMDTVIISAALPAITSSLQASSGQAYWCGSGFMIAQASAQPLYGSLSGIFGRKYCVLMAIALFTLGSLLCAVARSVGGLIGARVVQGLGSAGINVLANVITTDMVELKERGKYMGLTSLSGAVGLIAGVIIGSAVAQEASWRIIFWINLPVCIPAWIGLALFLNLRRPQTSFREKLMAVDWFGMVLFTSSLVAFTYGITAGGSLSPWSSAGVIVPLVLGLSGVAVFVVYEGVWAQQPMVPLRIFQNRTAISGYASSLLHALVMWSVGYYLILYFFIGLRYSLISSALSFLPGLGVTAPTAAVAGVVMSMTSRFKYANLLGWVLMTSGMAALSTLTIFSPPAAQYGYQILYGVGGGIIFPGRLYAVQASQKDNDVGIATTMVSFMTSLGESFGISIGGTIFQNRWNHLVSDALDAGAVDKMSFIGATEAERAAEMIAEFPEKVILLYRGIAAKSTATIWLVLACLSGLGVLVALLSEDLSLDRATKSEQEFIVKSPIEDTESVGEKLDSGVISK